ncbi:hypothetical protein LR48_Vigan641s007300 [Vigna angularis]|uniref:Uncharacterized protein n=2 Tax=Phaseolus angularis TaxID=3914 RepID=A0A0L9TF90_PHAAN|nr:hypothetical protein LR48_Vigan641s007300 [Vigna angularis]BAT85751.1 hypothetical protein VIGAN_04333400 [Vigna angularis var. angularis]
MKHKKRNPTPRTKQPTWHASDVHSLPLPAMSAEPPTVPSPPRPKAVVARAARFSPVEGEAPHEGQEVPPELMKKRAPEIRRMAPPLQKKARSLGRLIPSCRKVLFPEASRRSR